MARNRSVDLLPEIFKSNPNKEFLNSTLDQLVQEPKLRQTQGFIGRKFGAGIESGDSYVLEPTVERTNYQLEPSIVFTDDGGSAESAITYPEIVDALKTKGANVSKHDRLFSSPIYSWSPLIDFDKFVNHSQYYWLPSGPDSVDVSAIDIMLTDNFDITRNDTYSLSGIHGVNPTITLARGGEYTFDVNQTGHNFYIQSATGSNGVLSHASNISSRDVVGVVNNGDDNGIITFTVPESNNQQFYYDLPEIDGVDLATFDRFDSINGKLVSQLKNIDGIVDLEGKTIVFLNTTAGNSADLGWQYLDLHEDAPFESEPFEETTFIDSQSDRYSVYQIEYTTSNGEPIIKLNKIKSVSNLEKFDILYGDTYSNKSFYKNSSGFFQEIPLLTASQDTLYYQDADDEDKFGIINLVNSTEDTKIDVNDILGKRTHTSGNGVVFTNGLKVIFRGNVTPEKYQNNEYYVEGVGTAIKLISVTDLITPESYTTSELEPFDFHGFDSTNFDGNLNSPTVLDFITINRASEDSNPWSRSNRWVHKDVIIKTAEYNRTVATFDNNSRATRPIIEFDSNLKLFNFGTESKTPITAIDFNESDALSNFNGSSGFSIDGFSITNGSRVIFANDGDVNVRNKIYEVQFIDLEGEGLLKVNLVESSDTDVEVNQSIVCTNGISTQGKSYHFNGSDWIVSQQKTSVNQAPLLDVYDANGVSFSDSVMYSASTFGGTKMFSYKIGVGRNDVVLGFPLSFLNIDNLGDIVFDNNLYTDTFDYGTVVKDKVSNGFIRKYSDRTTFTNEIGWKKFINNTTSEQIFNFEYDGVSLIMDVLPRLELSIPAIKVYIENKFINSNDYTITTGDVKTTITFVDTITTGSEIKVTIISDTESKVAYYGIPKNLENNTFNENSDTLTLGTIRNHYSNLAQNLLDLDGDANGSNNTRDLGNIAVYGDTIIQNSSPIAPMAKFLHSEEFNFFEAIDFNANAFEKFKLKILDYVMKNDTYGLAASTILNNALDLINIGKGSTSAFYKSDMLVGTNTPTVTTHTITPISTDTFNIVNIYDFTKASNASILVYLNDIVLVKDLNYTVAIDSATITIHSTVLNVGDIVTIKEYETSIGSYVPNTPTKLGLYPKFEPSYYLDDTYSTPTNVIKGHDGSISVAFNDIRDDVLLEFETRIYNNIKVNNNIPIRDIDVIPGKFRTTEYSDKESTNILSVSFLNWVGWNRVDYKTQTYLADNELTWNYSSCSSKLDGSSLKGHWRGVYKNYYDTDTPHTTPWEMLGITAKPAWWENEYGPLPYTSGNLVLWEDLESGIIKEPGNNRVDIRYKRDGLIKVIPVDTEGNLLNPFVSIVRNYSQSDFKKSWVIGDYSPTETAWRRSSSYPFALQRLFALTKPAQYFALSIDRDRYVFDSDMNQYLMDSRYRMDTRTVEVQTNTNPKHSYINWIADYHNNNGCSCIDIKDQLSRIDVRLAYRMASYTDKNYLKIYTDKSSPDSSNTGLLLPDQSYDLLLHKNQSLSELQYSSVIVQKTDDGYSVHGHSITHQYFEILQSIPNSNFNIVEGDIKLPKDFTDKVTLVPYGYVFTNKNIVIDFLASYGAFLESRGLVFDSVENANTLNWGRMSQEFLAWTAQGWGTGSVVNLNPNAISLEFNKELVVVDNINSKNIQALDQNGAPLTPNDYVITRLDNNFKLTTINGKNINFLRIKSTSYEHLLVIDNVSIFNDLMYKPVSGLRQHRVRLVGFTTYDWNGQLDAQGFILNQDNIKEWQPNIYYTKGNLVKFKNSYWSAEQKIEPSEDFNFNHWTKIDYRNIKKGLLPNIANKAGQIAEYYNKKTTNLESDVDLLAMGLTGFRPRAYLNSLDDVSQVNFYTSFISNKGTKVSADSFRNVKFDKKITDYTVFENWAIREATFGNSGNKSYIELELDSSKLQNNPSVVEIINDSDTKVDSHQLIKIGDVYNQSEIHVSKHVFPVRTNGSTEIGLPIAGHVRTDDVDLAVFEITDLNGGAGVPFMNKLSSGSLIWVAKDTAYDWNIYRTDIQSNISSILPVDGKIEVTFFHSHDFVVNDKIVIQDISLLINGAYAVENIIDSKVIRLTGTIEDTFVNITSDSSITSDTELYTTDHKLGFVYKLTSVRLPNNNALLGKYIDRMPMGARVWVDVNDNNKHAVYQKYDVTGNITMDTGLVTSDNDVYTADGNGAWGLLHEEQDTVDVGLINKVLFYDKDTNKTVQHVDYLDPINGKILGAAAENINFIGATDPASYNQGIDITGIIWGDERVGEVWWDTFNIRYIDYNQTDLTYASKNWANLFPGSTVDIRQWVKSSVHPSRYSGPGTVVDVAKYTIISNIDTTNTIIQDYYFWVTDLSDISSNKTLSINNIKQYIEAPILSGVPFVAFLNNSTVGIYNSRQSITNSVLHISYNRTHSENAIFNEYKLIKENSKNDFLNDATYKKLQDSFIGGNDIGLAVPDIKLSVAERIGISFRPRQSMFENRFTALSEYLTQVNSILKKNIVTTNKDFSLLEAEEAMPSISTGTWDIQVSDIAELNYQNLDIVAIGYKYLVTTDTTNSGGGWSIHEVVTSTSGVTLQLTKIQKYNTTRAWTYSNWYENDTVETVIPYRIVSDTSKLSTLVVDNETYVKVSSNSSGKFELYQLRDSFWVRVGLEDGTIQFNTSLWGGASTQDNITIDSNTFTTDSIINTSDTGTGGIELRNVIRAINEHILVDELLLERNKLLISIFNYILSEQGNIDWLYKTSLIDVEHKVRDLEQYATYKKDDQDFLLNYLIESKPYHTKIKEFLLKYNGTEQYNTDMADFDVPTHYDDAFKKYVNPILDYDGVILTSDQSNFNDDGVGLTERDYNIWEISPWSNWYNNNALTIKDVFIVNSGSNYTTTPTITVTGGGATTQSTMTARINNSGQIIDIVIDNEGVGYFTTPTITITGGNGNGAIITPIMQNTLVRNLVTTIKYDRYEYAPSIINWESNSLVSSDVTTITVDNSDTIRVDSEASVHTVGQLVRHNDSVYSFNETRAFGTEFDIDNYTVVDSSTLSGVDRTMGFYNPSANNYGLNLPLLVHGIDYPGVEVKDLDFNNSAGFSVLPFDTTPFDVITVLADGSSSGVVDTEYSSVFNDMYLGTQPSDINADGGEFIDVYSSHSPEELIPGSMFDTLSMVISTRPGFDYDNNGHAFEVQYELFEYTPSTTEFNFNNIVEYPIAIKVVNTTDGLALNETFNYTIDWVNGNVTVISGASDSDVIQIFVYEIGGGNQLYRNTYTGNEIGNEITIPVESKSIYNIVVHVDGVELVSGFTATSDGSITVDSILETVDANTITVDAVSTSTEKTTTINFTNTYTSVNFVAITVFGFESEQHEHCYPTTKSFTPFGADSSLYTTDTNEITADNISTSFELGVGSSGIDKAISTSGKNRHNAIVEHNGLRLRSPEAVRYTGDAIETNFKLPTSGRIKHSLVSNSEIVVYVDNILQTLNTDYIIVELTADTDTITADTTDVTVDAGVVTADTTSTTVDTDIITSDTNTLYQGFKQVAFIGTTPLLNTIVDVYITTNADYTIDGTILNIKDSIYVSATDKITVTTWNDTSQLDVLTSVFKGPTLTTEVITELFDSAGFDIELFDSVTSEGNNVNLFELGRTITSNNRLWVTRNGNILLAGNDYVVSNSTLLIIGDLLSPSDEIIVTSITDDVVPEELSFRLFKDMNGSSAMYKVNNSVVLTKKLNITDEAVYVNDASILTTPNLDIGIFGIIIINGERITYREVNLPNNTISGLRRGTAGTAIKEHSLNAIVNDVSIGNIVTGSVITSSTLGSDTNTVSSTYDSIWYGSGDGTPSNGIALQDQVTTQANFIKN